MWQFAWIALRFRIINFYFLLVTKSASIKKERKWRVNQSNVARWDHHPVNLGLPGFTAHTHMSNVMENGSIDDQFHRSDNTIALRSMFNNQWIGNIWIKHNGIWCDQQYTTDHTLTIGYVSYIDFEEALCDHWIIIIMAGGRCIWRFQSIDVNRFWWTGTQSIQ